MTSLTILSSVLWVVSTAPCIWQSLVLFGSCLRSTVRGLFWEMTSGYVVFSASWFDSGYTLLSVYGGFCLNFLFSLRVDSDPAVDSRPALRGVCSLSRC